ncbi:M20/M25/M40 family metallo-hydrolase [Nonomuraea antri]|uniref:M20/M25/M40 family metallo-hydrolase n=1 Tax=Nonomuraea antri TaxID=2730852 RepID=UPI001C2C8CFA|nr:M20/M25/M40 family metallo-hydrolase [Nonomuraea antri]
MRRPLTALIGALAVSASAALVTPGAAAVSSAPPDIPAAAIMRHLDQFQSIATSNGGNRAHGRPGYAASADYVQRALTDAGFQVSRQAFTHNGATGWNVVADWPYGDPAQVVMAGAHLDGVTAGPGINDNASGSAAVLETALTVARSGLRPQKRLRFGWWGAEELGLIGSAYYTQNLGATERAKIKTYLNFDMVGAKNTTTWGVYTDSTRLRTLFDGYFRAKGVPSRGVDYGARSDHASFKRYGIEVSGIASGSDPCYHSACDTISNVSSTVMTTSTNAIAHAVWELAGTPVGDDFSMTVSPPSASVEPGGSATATVGTAVTNGTAQSIALSASGLPAGATASFEPATVTAGASATMTIATGQTTPGGTFTVTVTGTGAAVTRTAAFTLTVNGASTCASHQTTRSGTLQAGSSAYQPDDSYYQSTVSGTHRACLDGPDGTDYDLYLQKWNGSSWANVASSTTPGPDENVSYAGTSGYYRYRVHAYSGSGGYTLGFDRP